MHTSRLNLLKTRPKSEPVLYRQSPPDQQKNMATSRRKSDIIAEPRLRKKETLPRISSDLFLHATNPHRVLDHIRSVLSETEGPENFVTGSETSDTAVMGSYRTRSPPTVVSGAQSNTARRRVIRHIIELSRLAEKEGRSCEKCFRLPDLFLSSKRGFGVEGVTCHSFLTWVNGFPCVSNVGQHPRGEPSQRPFQQK